MRKVRSELECALENHDSGIIICHPDDFDSVRDIVRSAAKRHRFLVTERIQPERNIGIVEIVPWHQGDKIRIDGPPRPVEVW
jgi:hypothetical protein